MILIELTKKDKNMLEDVKKIKEITGYAESNRYDWRRLPAYGKLQSSVGTRPLSTELLDG